MPYAGPPGHTASLYTEVGTRCPAAVKALSMAVLMDVIFAPSMRAKARRWQDASTMAMFIGTPISSARFSAAARARRAPVRVRVGVVFVDMFDVLVNVQGRLVLLVVVVIVEVWEVLCVGLWGR